MESMAEVKIKNLENVKRSIKKTFEEIRTNEQMLVEIGNATVDLTKKFNRSGKSPDGSKHPNNSPAWEIEKMNLTEYNNPSEYYRPYLSNVTFTGQLLESIKLVKINRSNSSVEIDATGERTPYKNKKGKSVGKKNTPTNKKLVEYLGDIGRNIFGINKQMTNVINKIVRRYINEEIKKRFNKSR